MTIFQDLRVVELSATGAAAMAGKYFADWGAAVTVLEPEGGTPLRNEPPYYHVDGERRSGLWAWLSRGKTAVRVGERFRAQEARELCERADVVLIETALTASVLGLEPAQVRPWLEQKATAVFNAPFAVDGPYAQYDATDLGVNALGGWMSVLGNPDREPLSASRGLTWRITGMFAFVAALISLRHARQGGAPQFVDLSAQAVAASVIIAPWLVKSMVGIEYSRNGNPWPMGVMQCADGYIGCPPLTTAHWELLCQMMGIEDVLDDPQGRELGYRYAHAAELQERVRPWLMARTRADVVRDGQAWRLPAAPVQTLADRLACPQLAARGFWQNAEIDGKTVKVPRMPLSIEGFAPVERAPLREVDTLEMPPARDQRRQSATSPLPFDGVRVLDLTMLWSGPYATMLLGALGADVIKIESVQRPDSYRYTWAPVDRERWFEFGPLWNDVNCNKRDVTLDLASEDGRRLFERLVEHADVVVSNFSNRVMPNLGLSNERLLQINPRLIAVTMPGYGMGGPWENYVGYAIAFEQLVCGWMTGYADGLPSYSGGFCDPLVGLHVVAGIEMALQRREETGRGLQVEVPQCEVLDSMFAPEHIAILHGAPVPVRNGNKHDWMAPHDAYRVAGDDEWITIAVASDLEFAALARGLCRPELARDDRFATAAARKQHEAALDAIVADAVQHEDGVALEQRLQAAGVKACRVSKGYLLTDDPGLQHIGFFQGVTREFTGTHAQKRWPFRFSSLDASHKRQPPLLGEHNREVLAAFAGVSDEELARLEAQHVIGTQPLGVA